MRKTLYYGTSHNDAFTILSHGFNYENGLCFSTKYDDAENKAGYEGIVLCFDLDLECYYLEEFESKKDNFNIPDGYNCFVNPNGS